MHAPGGGRMGSSTLSWLSFMAAWANSTFIWKVFGCLIAARHGGEFGLPGACGDRDLGALRRVNLVLLGF